MGRSSKALMVSALVAGLTLRLIGGCSELPADIPLINSYEAQLADHLNTTGARMYGAYWCPYCAEQKELFGGAAARIPYIECDPQGLNSQTKLCQEKGIKVYPTWEIQGEFHEGVLPVGLLAEMSGFRARSEQ